MKYRLAMWAGAGFLVAGCWALYALVASPHTNEWMRNLWAVAGVTCPAILVGTHLPLSLYSVLAANAATYAVVGLIVEALRSNRIAHNTSN